MPTYEEDLANILATTEEVADTLAEDRAALRATRAEAKAQADFEALLPRFVALVPGLDVWDRQAECLVKFTEFDAYPPVVAVMGYKTGTVSASTRLVRSKTKLLATGFVSLPGVHADLALVWGKTRINTWKPGMVAGSGYGGGVAAFLEHQTWMIPDPHELAGWLDWLAYKVQYPALYTPLVPMLWGSPGVGKDLTLSLMTGIWGAANVAVVQQYELTGAHNQFLRWQYCLLSEFSMDAGRDGLVSYGRIKAWTGSPLMQLTLNEKYRPSVDARVQPTFVLTSNDERALVGCPVDDRRLSVIGCTPATGRDDAYFDTLAGLYLDPLYQQDVLAWLLARKVTGFSPYRPVRGPSWSQLMVGGLSDGAQRAYEYLTGGLAGRSVVTAAEVTAELGDVGAKSVHAAMVRAGCVFLGQETIGTQRLRIYSGVCVFNTGVGISVAKRDSLKLLGKPELLTLLEYEMTGDL